MRKSSLLTFFINLLALLPFWALYLLSDVLFVVLYYVVRYRKDVVYENLRNAFPEKSEAERRRIARDFFRFLPDLMVEAIKMSRISAAEVERRIVIRGMEELQRHFAAGRAVIGVTAHYGNWELGIHRLSLLTDNPVLIIYKPLKNKAFDTTYNNIRSRFGAEMVPMSKTLRRILSYRNTPHVSMFVADQTPSYRNSDYFVQFLNQPTLVYTGVERIAKATDSPIVFCHIDRVRRGYYQCTFTTLVEHPKEIEGHGITDIHTQFTEEIIRRKPALWLWSHRRWKRKPRT